MLQRKTGSARQTAAEVEGMERDCGSKSSSWQEIGSEQLLRGMWEYFTLQRAWARKIKAEAARGKQEGKQGQWQQESPFTEVLEQETKRNTSTDCNAQMMRRAYNAEKSSDWENSKEEFRKRWAVNGLLRGFRRLMTRLPWRMSVA